MIRLKLTKAQSAKLEAAKPSDKGAFLMGYAQRHPWQGRPLAYNLRRLHRLVRGAKNGVPKPQPPSMGWNSLRISLAREWPRKAIPNIFRRLHGLAAESTANLALTPTGS